MKVQDFIRTRRIDLGLTMKQVAEFVGVAEATVSRWESGDIANMRRDRIFKLSQVLKISPMVLMEAEVPEQQATIIKTKKELALEWIRETATKEEKAEIMTAILQSSPIEDAKELLKTYLDILMK